MSDENMTLQDERDRTDALRLEALRLAAHPHTQPDEIVARAEAFFAFLRGDLPEKR